MHPVCLIHLQCDHHTNPMELSVSLGMAASSFEEAQPLVDATLHVSLCSVKWAMHDDLACHYGSLENIGTPLPLDKSKRIVPKAPRISPPVDHAHTMRSISPPDDDRMDELSNAELAQHMIEEEGMLCGGRLEEDLAKIIEEDEQESGHKLVKEQEGD